MRAVANRLRDDLALALWEPSREEPDAASPPFHSSSKIGERHGFITVRAQPARPNAAAEAATVGTPLLSQVPRLAGGALVDRLGWRGPWWDRQGRGSMAAAPKRLAARRSADALAAHRRERLRAHGAGNRHAIVTPRALSHASHLPPMLALALMQPWSARAAGSFGP